MGNQILGKRSRNFFKGFNERQVDYIKEKFSVMAKKDKEGQLGQLDRNKFIEEYKLTDLLADRFFVQMNFDDQGGIDEYEFICAVHSFCNMTVSQLGETLFNMVTSKSGKSSLTQKQLLSFTEVCIRYNGSLQNKNFEEKDLKKINKDKFKKYDYDKSNQISKDEFKAICTKDQDYKKWFFNMGFITKNQLQFNDQVYDLVDSDVDDEIQRHLTKTDPKKDKLKRGFEHKIPDQNDFEEEDDDGDQSAPPSKMKNKEAQPQKQKNPQPWETYIKEGKCQFSKKYKQNKNSPSQTLTMKYVFGYRSFDCRNNIEFDSKGNAVYHQGAVGIVMDKDNKQNFMNQHKDDIVCLDVSKNLVVTGEMGTKPSVILWDTTQKVMKSKLIITDELKESVGNVAFSKEKDGPEFLAVNCNDSDHTLIVYKLLKKDKDFVGSEIKSKGILSKNAILDLRFTSDSMFIVAASLKQILFVKYDGAILNASRGEFGQFSNSCALCLLPLQAEWKKEKKNWMLSGMTNGSIYFWEQDKCKIARPGHSGSVSALAQIDGKGNNLFVSGDKSGNIFVWDRELKISNKCSIAQTQGFSSMIVSLSVYNSDEILVGTKSSTVYRSILQKDLILNERHTIMSGHCEGNLWGLTVEQTQSFFFYTGGEDQRLMKWRYGAQNKLEKEIKCKYKIRSLSHNPTNSLLAVGYMNGVIQILTEDLKPLSDDSRSRYQKIKNPDKEILNLVKFKKDGKSLAACYTLVNSIQSKKQTQGYKVIIFSFDKALKEQKSIELSSKIIALDFDLKGEYLRLNTQNKEFYIYDMKGNPAYIEPTNYNRRIKQQVEWESHSTFMSPQTRGFKTEGVTQADIVCCQRNRLNRNVVVFGDKYSNIKLFNYPCITYPIFSKYQGHSNAITAMEFNSGKAKGDNEYLISIGGQEKSIIVWHYDPDKDKNQQFFNQDLTEIVKQEVVSQFQKVKGQEKPATPQYVGQIKQPTHFKENCNPRKDNKLPSQDLSIEHVFGIRNQYLLDEVRNMCRFTQNYESILFPTACLGVQMNIRTKQQNYYHEHKEDIVSFAVDKSRKYMATGQMAEKNTKDQRKKIVSICVWDIKTHKLLKKLDGFHTIAVVLLDFSPSGKYLFSVGNDDKNTFAVYDWKAGSIVYSGPVSGGKVNGIAWKNQNEFITCGMDHVKFWQKGKGKQGKFDSKHKLQSMFSCIYYDNDKDGVFLTGGGSGTVFVWKGNTTVSSIRAHGTQKIQISKQSKPSMKVHTIVQRFKQIYTGGDDGIINEWKMEKDWSLTLVTKVFDSRNIPKILNLITSQKNIESDQCGILSIDFADDKDNSVLAVTKGASVVMFSLKGKNIEVVHQGHYKGQLWGLGTFQKSTQTRFIVTGGDDCTVRMWDLKSKEQVSRIYLDQPVRAIDCQQSDDRMIVAADKKAQIYLLNNKLKKTDTYTGEPYKINNEANKKQGSVQFDHFPWVQQIKFSPQGDNICYGTHGLSKFAQIVPVQKDKFNLKSARPFKVGSSAVNHIDWSREGNQIAINTQAWQYRFFSLASIKSKKQDATISASSIKDENWATYSRKYGFQSQGIFQGPDHTDINTVCRFITEPDKDNPKGILAVGYDDQSIRLFKYPAYNPNQVFKEYFGHSSHVTKIKFTDRKMVSIGGLDRTVIVWEIKGLPSQNQKKNLDQVKEADWLDELDDDVDVPVRALKRKRDPVRQEDFTQVLDQGDEFMAVKPWLGAIKQPTQTYPKSNGVSPNAKIQLSYVFGYRAKDCRQNLFYKDSNTIIFHAAAVLIEHNISTKEQKLFNQHNDDILSIDYHREKDRVVTGQLGPKPLVCFYEKGDFKYAIKAPVIKGVIAIAISPNGKYVACVGMDDNHGIAVIDWESKTVVKLDKTTNKLITKIKWKDNTEIIAVGINFYGKWSYTGKQIKQITKKAPKSNNVSLDISTDGQTILVGANFSSLFDYSKGEGSKPVWTLKYPPKNPTSKQQHEKQEQQPKSVVATSEQQHEKQEQQPKSVVECIKITENFIACGMRTGDLVFFDKKLKQINMIKLQEVIKDTLMPSQQSENTCIRAIDFLPQGHNIKVLVGTLGSQIYQFMIDQDCKKVDQEPLCIIKSHYAPNSTWTNQVWGLAIPEGSSDYVLSCSDDSTIRVWKITDAKDVNYVPSLVYCHNVNRPDSEGKKVLIDPKTKKYPDHLRLRSIAVSPNHQFIAVGAFDGTLRIFKLDLNKKDLMIKETQLYVKKVCKQWISDIKFGFKTLIVGSHDNAIYVFDFDLANEEREGKADPKFDSIKSLNLKLKYRPMNKHSSYITHLDVSRDSCFLQSTCGAYQILFWDLNAGKQLPGGATMLKNEKWKTWTCNIGWPVQGIYPKQQDGTFINAVDRSNSTMSGQKNYQSQTDFYLLAAGNDHGKVCLYNYPCLVKNSDYIEGKGHSSHVTTVRWMANDQHIISVGGEDQCVMVWKVQKNVTSNYSVEKSKPKSKATSPEKNRILSAKTK